MPAEIGYIHKRGKYRQSIRPLFGGLQVRSFVGIGYQKKGKYSQTMRPLFSWPRIRSFVGSDYFYGKRSQNFDRL